jgi:hypothetical protein
MNQLKKKNDVPPPEKRNRGENLQPAPDDFAEDIAVPISNQSKSNQKAIQKVELSNQFYS